MQISKYSLGQLQENCYFLVDEKDCLLIDPGDGADFILEKLQRENLNLVGILATHGHFDHIMAVGEIQLSCDVPLYIHKDDLFLVKRLNETAEYFLGYNPASLPPKQLSYLMAGTLEIRNFKFKILYTPGHTPGSCCFYFEPEGVIFTGDTLFKDGIGRYDFSYSDKKLLNHSLRTLFTLPPDTIVYSGHGEKTTMKMEQNRY